jgi:hypothetical protein
MKNMVAKNLDFSILVAVSLWVDNAGPSNYLGQIVLEYPRHHCSNTVLNILIREHPHITQDEFSLGSLLETYTRFSSLFVDRKQKQLERDRVDELLLTVQVLPLSQLIMVFLTTVERVR